jgi:hypothetical protein
VKWLTPRRALDAAPSERDRLLLRVLWATGARISEALALRSMDVRRDSLVLPNLKSPSACSFLLARRICQALSCSRLRNTDWRMTSRCSSRANGPQTAERVRSLVSKPGNRPCSLGSRQCACPRAAHLAVWQGRRAGTGASTPVPPCTGPPARPDDQELADRPEAGWLVTAADGLSQRE